jgi:hypothetical protein
MKTLRSVSLSCFFSVAIVASVRAADYQLIEVNPGQSVDVYFEINLSGTVALRIETAAGPGCAEFWWIKWPFGNISSLGKLCGITRVGIPGLSELAISGKLRASGVTKPTKIIAASNERVANSVTVRW